MNILFFLKPKSELAYINKSHTLRQAMEIMEHYRYSSVPIIDTNGRYVGTITEGDLLWYFKKNKGFDLIELESINIMQIERRADYDYVRADSDMEDLIIKATNQNFVPVVDDRKHFIGIITRKDIIIYYFKNMKGEEK
ncbi:MAG: CBS domain-containing protein [Suipraeoptans sp.]